MQTQRKWEFGNTNQRTLISYFSQKMLSYSQLQQTKKVEITVVLSCHQCRSVQSLLHTVVSAYGFTAALHLFSLAQRKARSQAPALSQVSGGYQQVSCEAPVVCVPWESQPQFPLL